MHNQELFNHEKNKKRRCYINIKQNQMNIKKSFLGLMLSVAMISTSIILPVTAFADKGENNPEKLSSNIISTLPADNQKVVRPDTPVEIVLKANDKVLEELNIDKDNLKNGVNKDKNNDENNKNDNKKEKDNIGILISDGQKDFLATESNGNLTVNYDKSSNTVRINVQHQNFTRYTIYSVYLLEKDALNKYEASLKSYGHSMAFKKVLKKDNDKHLLNFSFTTGSDIGEARNWTFSQNHTGKVLSSDGVTVTATAYDDYGDSATTGSLAFKNATDNNGNVLDGITVQPSESQLINGSAQVFIASNKTQEAILNFEAKGSYTEDTQTYKTNIYFIKPVPAGSNISINVQKNSDESFTVNGNVKLNGNPVDNVGVPLNIKNGTLSDNLPVTDSNGNFTVTLTKDNVSIAFLSIDNNKVQNVDMPVVGIDPVIYGNQAWTDTGLSISSPNTLITVQSTGTWADNLYAKIGANGTPVKIGSNGGFVTGITGELYLGPNNTLYSDNVDSIIQINDPKSIGIYPTMNINANPTQINADGKSTSTISGQVLYGQYPLVDGKVNLSATLGTLDTTTPTTNATGNYSAVFTAGTTAGTATVNGSFDNLNQSVSIKLINSISYGTWVKIGNVTSYTNNINSIVIDSNTNTLYANVDYLGIYKTTDGGITWQFKNLSNTNSKSIAINTKTGTIYAGTNTGIYKSTNGGTTWQNINIGLPSGSTYLPAVDSNTGILYVVANNGKYIYKSLDEGKTWQYASSGLPSSSFLSLVIDPYNANIVYAGTYYGLYKTIDGGNTWNKINQLPSELVQSLKIDPKTDTIYAVIPSKGIYKSTDGGNTWSNINNGLTPYIYDVVINPNDANIMFATTYYNVYITTNEGNTWSDITGLLSGERIQSMTIDPKTNALYVGTSGIIYKLPAN